MKAIKGFEHCNRKKFFVVLALSLCLCSAVSLASPARHQLYGCSRLHLIMPADEPAITGWILDKTVGNVDFYHIITVCNGKKTVFLKFNNKNSYSVKVTWKEVFKTRSEERKDGYIGKKELVLSSGTTTPNDCTDAANKKSILLPSEIDPMSVSEILDFSFKEITVNTL
jgi:hypothetical protein